MSETLLSAQNISMTFPADEAGGVLQALDDVSFSLARGERLGIVGESGAGKSLLASVLINLPPVAATITNGEVLFEGQDLLKLPQTKMRGIRGRRIGAIFQDPMTTLNPVLTVGEQLVEILTAHNLAAGEEAHERCVARLREVAIPSPEKRMEAYPHELSGGMRQRVVIAAALLAEPALIIADEPTTALDVTTQAEIMSQIGELCARRNMGLILITHDLSLMAQTTDSIMIMYAGAAVERGKTADVVQRPRHPYTQGLLDALGARRADGRFGQIRGSMPPLSAIPSGCRFHPRCNYAQDKCKQERPLMNETNSAACHYSDEIASRS